MKLNEMQLYSAINEYIDKEIMPLGASMKMTEQFAFGFKMGVVKRKIQNVVKSYLNNDASKILGIVDDSGYIDIDTLYQSAKDVMAQMQQITVAGLTFKDTDLVKLYSLAGKYAQ